MYVIGLVLALIALAIVFVLDVLEHKSDGDDYEIGWYHLLFLGVGIAAPWVTLILLALIILDEKEIIDMSKTIFTIKGDKD